MGLLINGQWHDQWSNTSKKDGFFSRESSQFRHWITPDGSPGKMDFKAEKNRYHLYVSYACPWAHRTLIYRTIKQLDSFIDVSIVDWLMADQGWTFSDSDGDGLVQDHLYGLNYAHELYSLADANYTGRVTVPILWDTQQKTIVSNESADIIRMLNSAFDHLGANPINYYPTPHQQSIDNLNKRIYETLNNGVYQCGFATSQAAYDQNITPLFETLDWLENILAKQRFLTGPYPMEADWLLFPTLLRFDLVYVGHFKCSKKRIIDYPHLWGYTRDLYQWPGIQETINLAHIHHHYHCSHPSINPYRILPILPELDFTQPHERGILP